MTPRGDWDGSERRQLPADWLIRELQQLRRDMTAGFEKLERKFDTHAAEDAEVEHRVTVIETERAGEGKQAVKRGTLIGIVAGAGAAVVADLVKGLFQRP